MGKIAFVFVFVGLIIITRAYCPRDATCKACLLEDCWFCGDGTLMDCVPAQADCPIPSTFVFPPDAILHCPSTTTASPPSTTSASPPSTTSASTTTYVSLSLGLFWTLVVGVLLLLLGYFCYYKIYQKYTFSRTGQQQQRVGEYQRMDEEAPRTPPSPERRPALPEAAGNGRTRTVRRLTFANPLYGSTDASFEAPASRQQQDHPLLMLAAAATADGTA